MFNHKLQETGSTLDTTPNNYVGYEVGEDGKKKKKKKDMKDKDLHEPTPPDGPEPPKISLQAEAVSFYLVREEEGFDLSKAVLQETPQTVASLKVMQRVSSTDPTVKIIFETAEGQRGYVSPALFIKVYSKMLVSEQEEKNKEPKQEVTMNESKPNMALAHELLALGLVNNVKKTTEVLREANPMRKAMEIYYSSPNSVDKDKPQYMPSVMKDGKAVLTPYATIISEKPPCIFEKSTSTTVGVEPKKKRIIYW